ncbi:hypothetical protein V1509DRAFT_636754 [Lipomyces kononenkoae]
MAPCNPTAKSGLDVIRRCYRRVQQSRLLASQAADGIAPGPPSPQTELEDTGHGLNCVDIDLRESTPFEPYALGENSNVGLPPPDYATHFDKSYWLQQIEHLYSTADAPEYDPTWELPSISGT